MGKLFKALLSGAVILCASQAMAVEYLVKYKNQMALQSIHDMASMKSAGMSIIDAHASGSYVVVDMQEGQEVPAVASLLSNSDIEWVVPNFQLHAVNAPLAGNLKEQWAMAKIQATKAWERAGNRGSKSVIVAMIDSGVDYRHKNLSRNMLTGYDFAENDADPMDDVGHGTHCSGVIGADGAIDGGIVGISPEVSIMPIRFLGKRGQGDLNSGIKAIDYAIEHGAQIISASWGANQSAAQAKALIEAVKRADDKGLIFVAAAANSGKNNDKSDFFPTNADTPNMIAVAASGAGDAKPNWSNYGRAKVHIAAPGEGIMSTVPGDSYKNMSGTSMAAPLVSGLVAFLKAQDPTLTGAQVRALLQTTGVAAKIETACNCRIDAFNAVDHLLSKKMWMVPAAATLTEGQTITVQVMNGKAPFTFASSNPAVMTVDALGAVTPVTYGSVQITATDADGKTVSSLDFNSLKGTAPEEPATCPMRSPKMCERACKWFPNLKFCKKP